MKTYPISAVAGVDNPAPLDASIIPPTINTASLAALVMSIFDSADGLVGLAVDVFGRRILGYPAVDGEVTAALASLFDADGVTADATLLFLKGDMTKRASNWTVQALADFVIGAGAENAFQDILKPQVPVLTTGQLVGQLEDAMIVGGPLEAANFVVVLDQGIGHVHVIPFDSQAQATAAFSALADPTIGYKQTPTAAITTVRQKLE